MSAPPTLANGALLPDQKIPLSTYTLSVRTSPPTPIPPAPVTTIAPVVLLVLDVADEATIFDWKLETPVLLEFFFVYFI